MIENNPAVALLTYFRCVSKLIYYELVKQQTSLNGSKSSCCVGICYDKNVGACRTS